MPANAGALPFVEPDFDADAITRLLGALTVQEREVVILTKYCGYTTKRAARTLGLSEAAVLARERSGMARLATSPLILGLASA